MERLKVIKNMYLSTSHSTWKNTLTTVLLLTLCIGFVALFGYLSFTIPKLWCHRVWLYFSVIWLFIEIVVIGYLFLYKNIPRFAREAITLIILISNVWFGLFIFGLDKCL